MKIYCENLGHRLDLPERPERVVSLTSGATEALFAMGCGRRVAGVSAYCSRYVPGLTAPVVGDYLRVDDERLAEVRPDLVLVTTGVQRKLGLELAERGFPVYALPLPASFHGILENVVTLAGLMNHVTEGRALAESMASRAADLRRGVSGKRPRVYVELWFGKHMRSIGGQTYIHDLVTMAGGAPILGDVRGAYVVPDFNHVMTRRPEILLFFSEPEYPVDFHALLHERGWDTWQERPLIQSTIQRGENVIHDGPSILETAVWLRREIRSKTELQRGR